MILGELKRLLESQPEDKVCVFGFGFPHSHRGYYHHVSFPPNETNITISKMLEYVNTALDIEFEGWKGGLYRYNHNTTVHFNIDGCCSEDDINMPSSIYNSIIEPVQDSKFPNIEEEQDLWAVWNNTDLTEGRGAIYVQHVCEAKSTAIRLAKKAGIQGCDADVIPVKAYRIGKNWYYRGKPVSPNEQDRKEEIRLKQEQELKEQREKVLKKAIGLGLTAPEIELLRGLK